MGLFDLDANYILHLQQKSNSVMRNKETRFFNKMSDFGIRYPLVCKYLASYFLRS